MFSVCSVIHISIGNFFFMKKKNPTNNQPLMCSLQISLLCGLLIRKIAPHMQFIVLRSFRYMLEKASHITDGALLLENLLKILDDKQGSSPLRCEALQLAATVIFW